MNTKILHEDLVKVGFYLNPWQKSSQRWLVIETGLFTSTMRLLMRSYIIYSKPISMISKSFLKKLADIWRAIRIKAQLFKGMQYSHHTQFPLGIFSLSCFYKFFDILPDHICLKVYGVSGLFETEGGLADRMRDDGHGESLPLDLIDCEADPLNGNGTFVDQVSQDLRGCFKGEERGLTVN